MNGMTRIEAIAHIRGLACSVEQDAVYTKCDDALRALGVTSEELADLDAD